MGWMGGGRDIKENGKERKREREDIKGMPFTNVTDKDCDCLYC